MFKLPAKKSLQDFSDFQRFLENRTRNEQDVFSGTNRKVARSSRELVLCSIARSIGVKALGCAVGRAVGSVAPSFEVNASTTHLPPFYLPYYTRYTHFIP